MTRRVEVEGSSRQKANGFLLLVNFLGKLEREVSEGKVTLVYGAKDQEHNGAVVLREFLEAQITRKNSHKVL